MMTTRCRTSSPPVRRRREVIAMMIILMYHSSVYSGSNWIAPISVLGYPTKGLGWLNVCRLSGSGVHRCKGAAAFSYPSASLSSSTRRRDMTKRRRRMSGAASLVSANVLPSTRAFPEHDALEEQRHGNSTCKNEIVASQTTCVGEDKLPGQPDKQESFLSMSTSCDTMNSASSLEMTLERESILQQIEELAIGTINDQRYIFPEYVSGDVPRLFSTLQYRATSSRSVTTTSAITTATHAKGSVLAASALVTGTTVGAGVLALPTATATTGMIPSAIAMVVGYCVMSISGLLMAELVLNRIGQTGKPSTTGLMELYTSSFGPMSVTSLLSQCAYFFYHYALMVAYIAQGGVVLTRNVTALMHLPWSENLAVAAGSVGFATFLAVALYAIRKSAMQQVNTILVVGVYITFACTLALGAQTAEYFPLLWDPSSQHPDEVLDALPVIFLAFVYQNIVPVIVKDLEGDRNKITQAILIGTTVPLLMFLSWNAVVLAHIAPGTDLSTVNAISLLQESGGDMNQLLAPLVSAFSILAIVTSLIGFTYGLLDSWTDVFKLDVQSSQRWKLPLFGLIFVPPLLLAVAIPDVFQTALEYGGAFGVSTLFLVLPPLMVWNERYGAHEPMLVSKPMVPLGKIPLVFLWLASTILIVQQSVEKFGLQV